ncbi:MAG: selenide, water dikinase SelD [Deltaproteobacteria bacterium]|nr:MAG: selenide, water dikinase SelD [Deltaproteobacteria bacterium]
MERTEPPTEVVLVGGGHSHVQVLRMAMMEPFAGARLTLIVDDPVAVYSGMVPGVISGQYAQHEVEIDVRPLARKAGARLIIGRAIRVEQGRVHVEGRPPVPYDLCSVNVGSTVAGLDTPGVRAHAVATRPIARLVSRWREEVARLRDLGKARIVVVGGGAGGVELAFCARERLLAEGVEVETTLIHGSSDLLPGRSRGPRQRVIDAMDARGIAHRQGRVTAVHADHVEVDGEDLPADVVFWATGAAPHGLMRDSGYQTDARGFVLVDDDLRVAPGLFAVGDCAVLRSWREIPKAGVYAVREGPVLVDNLRRSLAGRELAAYKPQSDFLALLNLGDDTAIGTKWGRAFEGHLAWRWKDHIDRAFMDKFTVLEPDGAPYAAFTKGLPPMPEMEMVCGGCAAKVGQSSLERALADMPASVRGPEVVVGLEEGDDAAVIAHGDGLLVQSVDVFTAFTDDPWLVGRVAALNAISDLEVKGAVPRWALAIVNIPRGEREDRVLADVLRGARAVLDPAGVALLGGHSTVGEVLSVGFSVTGTAADLPPETVEPGQHLVLSRPLGTGVLWRADGLGQARGPWMDVAVAGMLRGNGPASRLAREHGATALTDVTGFGLAGHLGSLCRRHDVSAELRMDAVPGLPGTEVLLARGVRSTFHDQNRELAKALSIDSEAARHPRFELLFDPQTAGGLVAAVPADRVDALLSALRDLGEQPADIGVVQAAREDGAPLAVR